jgi:cytochrome c oxidase subunit 3
VVLAVLFFARKGSTHLDLRTLHQVSDWVPIHLPAILYLNTLVLILSSATMERARWHIFREIDVLEEWLGLGTPALTASRRWLAASATLGGLFLAGQWQAWRVLTAQGIGFGQETTPAAYFFYLMTGLHALHLVAGLGAVLFCLAALGFLSRVETRQIAIDGAAWFWHAMGLTWLVLFAILRLGQ